MLKINYLTSIKLKIKTIFLKLKFIHIIILLQLFGCYSSYSQVEISNFDDLTHYTKDDGLMSSSIGDIIEDRNGFIWMANGKGVVRFDGTHFINYKYYYKNKKAFKIGYVNSIVIDKSGEKLFFANDNGVFYSLIKTVNFKEINALSSSISSETKRINKILFDDQNVLWAASHGDGLLKIDVNKNEYDSFRFVNNLQNDNKQLNIITCITKDLTNSNVLWLGTLAGLIRFNSVTKDYKVFVYNDAPNLNQNRIRKIIVTNNNAYLGTWNGGLVVFSMHNQQFNLPLKNSQPKNKLILEFYKDNDQYLWITTGNGLLQFDVTTNTIKSNIDNNLSRGIVNGITYIDSRGVIWFGYVKGLFKYNASQYQNKFIQLEERNNLQSSLLIKRIIRFNGFIYVLGHDASGLYKINPIDYSFEIIKIIVPKNTEQTNRNLRDMVIMDDENLLILSKKELYIFNTKTQKSHLSQLQINHPSPSLQSIVKDKNNRYWVGGRFSGLTSLNFIKNKIINYKDEFNVYNEGNHIWINKLYLDNNNKLWIAKGSSSVLDLDDLKFSLLNTKDSIQHYQDVGGFLQDTKGRVWAAGYNSGLGFINFKDFKKGISHQIDGRFEGIYKYNDSIMWTTGNGLLGEFNITTNTHKVIHLNNDNQYLSGPIITNSTNEYLIGCNNGIIVYNLTNKANNFETPKPYIRKITGNGNIFYQSNSLTNKELSFKSGTNHLVIDVSALGFKETGQTSYSYKLNDEWFDLNTTKEINITNLDQGNYDFKIKACNEFGNCNETTYNFTILTPWYKSWLAYTLYGILILTIIWLLYQFNLGKQLAEIEKQKVLEVDGIKSKMYANISHEFRTPLTVILGIADTLKSNIKNKKFEGVSKSLEMIGRNGNEMLHMVNEMLDLSKSESGKMQLQLVQTDVIPLIKYICESFNSLADENQINLTVYSEIETLIMDFDSKKLTSILSNLLTNAFKFTPILGKIIVHINEVFKNNKSYLKIKVIDNGIGISDDELANIFNRYYQPKTSDYGIIKGTGIGLALTKELVDLMKGNITVKSELSKGSEFAIIIPVVKNAPISKSIEIDNAVHTLIPKQQTIVGEFIPKTNSNLPLVLIIEDNVDVAYYLKTCLKDKFETLHAIDGIEGIEMANKKIPDIIICDVMMPGKDGFEVCKTLKADECTDHIPIIILTAKVTTEDRLKGLSHGADAYLAKPFNKKELFIRLNQLLLLRKKLIDKIQKTGFGQFLNQHSKDPKIQFLQKVITLINEEIKNSTFGSEELSKKLQLSSSQVYRKIKAITGKSTAVFIRSIRLQYAKELLKNSDKTVSEVAYEVGFNNPSWFSRAFKEEFGYVPSSTSK